MPEAEPKYGASRKGVVLPSRQSQKQPSTDSSEPANLAGTELVCTKAKDVCQALLFKEAVGRKNATQTLALPWFKIHLDEEDFPRRASAPLEMLGGEGGGL